MKFSPARLGILCMVLLLTAAVANGWAQETQPLKSMAKELVIKRGFTPEALQCIECHSKKTPGIVAGWKDGRMSHAGISCYDCHVVDKSSPMASQCEGLKGGSTFISPMVSSKTCSRCHPTEVDQFLKSGHAKLASKAIMDPSKAGGKLVKLQFYYEGFAKFDGTKLTYNLGTPKGIKPFMLGSRASGCQMCHGTTVELGPDNKPINNTWPGGVGTRYPDGSVGTCTVCHERHTFSISDARKPEACGACHLGPDHPNIEIYLESKHGQLYQVKGEEWKYDSPPGAWEPGDYLAPTCATCHMSGIGDLHTTHNVQERLKWDLMHKKSVVRSGERGNGEKGGPLMRQVCANCHSTTHVKAQEKTLEMAVELYNTYWDGASKMHKELADKGLLGKDPWNDGFQELEYYLWHHTGRRARQGAAMNAPDYAHWHGFFQVFQVYQDMVNIYKQRLKTGKIEEVSTVVSSAPY